jgi:dolichyl-phosphate beta-glucosyltransferase
MGASSSELALSVVIPALDEAQRLPRTLERIYAHLGESPQWLPAEVIVVDDGSRDGTADAAASVTPADGVSLVLLSHSHNRGKGAAVRSGFAAAHGARVLLSDADLSAPIGQLARLAAADDGTSVVIGSRAVDRGRITARQPLYRDLMGRCFNLITRSLVMGGLADTQCGFKLWPGELASALAAVQRLDGFAYDVELLLRARRWGWVVREVAVEWRHVEASRVLPIRHSMQMLRDLLRLWWWLRSGAIDVAPGVGPASQRRV